MDNIHAGDKVVVRLKESYYSDGNTRPIVQGEVVYASPKGTYAVVNVGKYNVTYWNNEINLFDTNKYRYSNNGNRVEPIPGAASDDDQQ
mgnify:CR=1 FL=1